MLKRNLFVILSGIVAASSVLGWQTFFERSADNSTDGDCKAILAAQKIESDVSDPAFHADMIKALNSDDKLLKTEIGAVAADERTAEAMKPGEQKIIKLFSPDVVPRFEVPVAGNTHSFSDVLNLLSERELLKNAKLLAVIDLANGKVLASSDEKMAMTALMKIREAGSIKDGLFYSETGQQPCRVAWQCLDDEKEKCLLTLQFLGLQIGETDRCQAANTDFLNCNGVDFDMNSIVGAENCEESEAKLSIVSALKNETNNSGVVSVRDIKYKYLKTKLDNGCEFASIVEVPKSGTDSNEAPADVKTQSIGSLFSTKGLLLSVGGFLVMLGLGFLCTRRKDRQSGKETEAEKSVAEKKEEKDKSEEKDDKSAEKISALEKELESLKKENARMTEERDQANKNLQQEQMARMNLAEDNRRLKDAMTAGSEKTAAGDADVTKEKPAANAAGLSGMAELSADADDSSKKTIKVGEQNGQNRITSPAESETKELAQKAEADAFLDGFNDEGWEEIEDSFDSVFKSTNKETKVPLDNKSLSGFLNMLEGLDESASQNDLLGNVDNLESDKRSGSPLDADKSRSSRTLLGAAAVNIHDETQGFSGAIDEDNIRVTPADKSDSGVKRQTMALFKPLVDEPKEPMSRKGIFSDGELDSLPAFKGRTSINESAPRTSSVRRSNTSIGIKPLSKAERLGRENDLNALSSFPKSDDKHKNTIFGLSAAKEEIMRVSPAKKADSRFDSSALENVPVPSKGRSYRMTSVLSTKDLMEGTNTRTRDRLSTKELKPLNEEQQKTEGGALYDALKRSIKDVSEIDQKATRANGNAKQPSAFDFNRGLSKSGVFSVTGSRVDIDPLSDNEYFKSVYEKFVALQKSCGEENDMTLDRFVSRLAREKESIIKKFNCKTVEFKVYVKDGKASLKATPKK